MAESSSLPRKSYSPVQSEHTQQNLDLSRFPPIFVSATHFESEDLHNLEDELVDAGAALTYDLAEAKIVLSKATKKPRILFDLKAKGLWTDEVKVPVDSSTDEEVPAGILPPAKKPKLGRKEDLGKDETQAIVIDDSSTASELEGKARPRPENTKRTTTKSKLPTILPKASGPTVEPSEESIIKVIRIDWFVESAKFGKPLPFDDFLTYQGQRVKKPITNAALEHESISTARKKITVSKDAGQARRKLPMQSADILERAKEDAPQYSPRSDRFGKRKFGHQVQTSSAASWEAGHSSSSQYAHLLHKTTSEYDQGMSSDLPEPPEWVKGGVKYACERLTPRQNPNDPFIALLKQIKLARLLTNDEIGVRAYSTSIASLAAYPYRISNPREILALPGCDAKIANLYVEWANTYRIKAVEDIEADKDLKVLRLFYNIWGGGATTAREFYYDRGWKDLDDIVEFGWSTLSRVQQIGVKYYEEFLDLIPRAEVKEIGGIIQRHASKVRDENVQTLLVGGYRRGKEACGDVDIIVSHPDERQTLNIVNDIVASLEEEGWITHTLLLSLHSTHRDQQTLPFRAGKTGGHGFDTLDKALVVWQDPRWPSKEVDLANDPKAKNPNIHRRVDIIVSPWRTVGCAVAGWSGGTTFQRDLRRYAKNTRGWKFDSSGVRDRANGEVVDVEGFYAYAGNVGEGRARSMEEAEKRVFEGMGLAYREPWERCTG